MQVTEVRKDWFTKRVSVIATARGKRPKFTEKSLSPAIGECPFCPGNEGMTPPAQMVAVLEDGEVQLKLDDQAASARRWNVRVFPNMFPALSPDSSSPESSYGHHIIVVESPDHARDFDRMEASEIETYLKVLRFQVLRLNRDPRVNCVSIFKNFGEEAGASVAHPHSQIIASNFVPPSLRTEVEEYETTWREKGVSAILLLASEAERDQRVVLSEHGYVAFVPFAPISPYEIWVAPEEPTPSFEGGVDLGPFGGILRRTMSAVKKMHGDIAYNLYFHTPPRGVERFHWHVEIVPRTNKFAGYELGFGAYIITVSPEDAAQLYRQAL